MKSAKILLVSLLIAITLSAFDETRRDEQKRVDFTEVAASHDALPSVSYSLVYFAGVIPGEVPAGYVERTEIGKVCAGFASTIERPPVFV